MKKGTCAIEDVPTFTDNLRRYSTIHDFGVFVLLTRGSSGGDGVYFVLVLQKYTDIHDVDECLEKYLWRKLYGFVIAFLKNSSGL